MLGSTTPIKDKARKIHYLIMEENAVVDEGPLSVV